MTLAVGDKARPIRGVNQNGEEVDVGLSGKVVLYFYPEDWTPGCTTEACQFRDDLADYEEMGAIVVGVSTDDWPAHREFAQQHRLNFTLIADRDGAISRSYGVLDPVGRAQRVTYVIESGTISHVFPKVNPNGHSRQVWLTLFGQGNSPKRGGPTPADAAIDQGGEAGYDADKAWDEMALGLGQRFRDIVLAIDRVDALRAGPDPEGWLRSFLADQQEVDDAAEELVLRAFGTAADPVNFKLLCRLTEDRTVGLKELAQGAGLSRVRATERVNDLVQVGLCVRELEGDLVLPTAVGDTLVGLLHHVRQRLTSKVRESFAKRWERRALAHEKWETKGL